MASHVNCQRRTGKGDAKTGSLCAESALVVVVVVVQWVRCVCARCGVGVFLCIRTDIWLFFSEKLANFSQGGVIEVPETASQDRRLQRTVVQYLDVSLEVNKSVFQERIF